MNPEDKTSHPHSSGAADQTIVDRVKRDLEPLQSALAEPLDFSYDNDLLVDGEYKAGLPDLQNGAAIRGAPIKLERVGIHNFRLPIKYRQRDSPELIELETAVTGTVSLESCTKGINMSRIMRAFYEHRGRDFTIDTLARVLTDYKRGLNSFEAQIMVKFSYPILQTSLRSELQGFQYYDVILEMAVDAEDRLKKTLHLDFVYSSACPCSFELSEHARAGRHKATVPHSQRSVARISVKFDRIVWIEDLQEMCQRALQTETQVMVKREDEQAFAELNGSHLKFVEDAVRLLYEALDAEERISDFKVICSHLESLHSHDAVAIAAKGVEGGFTTDVTYNEFRTLLK